MKSFTCCFSAPLNRLTWAVLLQVAFLFLWAGAGQAQDRLLDVKLYAHRGVHTEHPENSLGAIQAAIDAGIHGTEIDLRTSADGKVILMHDPALDRTTNGHGLIKEKNWEEIRGLKLKNGRGELSEWGVPTFEQALELVKKSPGFELALDLKDVDAVQAARLVLDHGMAPQTQFFIADPMETDLAQSIKEIDPSLRISVDMLNWWKIEDVPSFAAAALQADCLFASEWFFPKRGFGELNKQGVPVTVYLWGVKDLKTRFEHAVALGASGVSSDNPLALLPYVRPLNSSQNK